MPHALTRSYFDPAPDDDTGAGRTSTVNDPRCLKIHLNDLGIPARSSARVDLGRTLGTCPP